MSTLVKTKRRINSVSSTRKITNAMELVSSVKLKRFKNSFSEVNEYSKSIKDIMTRLYTNIDKYENINLNSSNKKMYLIINSNLGLCGNYNNEIFKYVESLVNKDDDVIPIGLKGFVHYKNLFKNINSDYFTLNEKINIDDIGCLSSFVLKEFNLRKYKEINIIYTEYINSLTYKPTIYHLLPLGLKGDFKEELLPPIIEPNAKELLKELMLIYLNGVIYQCLISSRVSEQASRNNAMKNATDNADEILEQLKLEYNKARQSAITQEITEIISGANN